MVVAEALARGLPVMATATGGIRELVADEAGILVPAGNVSLLAEALTDVIGDPTLRLKLANGARRVRDRLPTWDEAGGQDVRRPRERERGCLGSPPHGSRCASRPIAGRDPPASLERLSAGSPTTGRSTSSIWAPEPAPMHDF